MDVVDSGVGHTAHVDVAAAVRLAMAVVEGSEGEAAADHAARLLASWRSTLLAPGAGEVGVAPNC